MKGVIIAASTNSELLANLLLMSKIPNSKKEEMYATYLEADKALKGVQQVDLKGEANADQVDIEHYPLFQSLKHQQYRA